LTANNFAQWVGYLGVAQMSAGYLWIVWMASRRDWQRGMLCALPPVTFWYLTRRKYAKYRPLRFVASGAVLLLLAGAAGFALPHTRAWAGTLDGSSAPAPAADIATQSKLAQLRYYRDQRAFDDLTDVLRTLSRTDPLYSEDAKNRAEISAELRKLCSHPDLKVKVEAMVAFALWGGIEARQVCLDAVLSTNQDERIMGLKLLARWKDPDVARRVAERVGRPGEPETEAARKTLEEIGQSAEVAVIAVPLRSKDQGTRLLAIDILASEAVGGPESVAVLRALAGLPDSSGNPADPRRVSDDAPTRQKAADRAQRIQDRLPKR
jgi:hypothetical protein